MPIANHAPGGVLRTISEASQFANNGEGMVCEINIPKPNGQMQKIEPKILPEITDSKSATFADTTVIGRSTPIKTYSHSDNRVLTIRLHYLVVEREDIDRYIDEIWAIESATYPRLGTPYRPPPICTISCGLMLGDSPLCCVLQNYNIQIPNNVVWDSKTLVPYYFQMNTQWHVVYSSDEVVGLPNQERILGHGR